MRQDKVAGGRLPERTGVGDGLPEVHEGVLHAVAAGVAVLVKDAASVVDNGVAPAAGGVEDGLLEQGEELGPVEPGAGEEDVAPDAVGVGDDGVVPARRHVQAVAVPVEHAHHVGAPPSADERAAGQHLLPRLDPARERRPELGLQQVQLLLARHAALVDTKGEDAVRLRRARPVEVAVGRVAVHRRLVRRVGDLIVFRVHGLSCARTCRCDCALVCGFPVR